MSHQLEYNGEETPGGGFDPDTILRAAWRRKGLLLVGLLVGVAISAAVSMTLPRTFQSTAQISILRKFPEAMPDSRLASPMDSLAPPTEVLRSPAIIENAIHTGNLGSLSLFAHVQGDLVRHIRTALAIVPSKLPAGQGNLFRLTYRDIDSEDCQTVLAAVLDSYRASLEKSHQTVAGNAIELILREQEKVRKDLARQEADYLAFRNEAPLLGKARDGLDLKQERLNSIQARRSALLFQKVEVEGRLAALEKAHKEGRSPEAVLVMLSEFAHQGEPAETAPRTAPSFREQLPTLLLEERRLLQLHGPRHPEVRSIQERIETARRLLLLPPAAWKTASAEAAGSPPKDPVQVHMEILRQRLEQFRIAEDLLAVTLQKEQDEARRLASFEIRNETFQSNITLNRQLYEALVKRLNDSSLIKETGGHRVEVIEPPSQAQRVSPNVPLNLAVGAFLGLMAGLLLALRAEGRTVDPDSRRVSRSPVRSIRVTDDPPSRSDGGAEGNGSPVATAQTADCH